MSYPQFRITTNNQQPTQTMSKPTSTYTIVVQAPAVNEWTYEVKATSEEEAKKLIQQGLDGDIELPDPVNYEQGNEVDGELTIVDSYES